MGIRVQRLLAGFSARETLLVVVAFAIGAASLLYLGVVEPLSAARQATVARLADRNELLEWMSAQAVESRALREAIDDRGTGTATGAAGIADIESSLGAHDLSSALTQLTPRPGGRFEARFEGVPYGSLMDWLTESRRRSGVSVTDIVIEATDRPDRVDAELMALMNGQRAP